MMQAREEADAQPTDYIGTEHLLLGLIHDSDDAVTATLRAVGVGPDAVRRQVEKRIGAVRHWGPTHLRFTSAARKTLERGMQEAELRGHDFVDAEHILCGLTREPDSTAAKALTDLGVEPARIRQQLLLRWDSGEQ